VEFSFYQTRLTVVRLIGISRVDGRGAGVSACLVIARWVAVRIRCFGIQIAAVRSHAVAHRFLKFDDSSLVYRRRRIDVDRPWFVCRWGCNCAMWHDLSVRLLRYLLTCTIHYFQHYPYASANYVDNVTSRCSYTWCSRVFQFCIFYPCDLVPRFPVLRFPFPCFQLPETEDGWRQDNAMSKITSQQFIYIFIRTNCSFKNKKLKKQRKKIHTTCQRTQHVKCILIMHSGSAR